MTVGKPLAALVALVGLVAGATASGSVVAPSVRARGRPSGSRALAAYTDVRPHEKNLFSQISHTFGKGISGTGALFTNFKTSCQIRLKRKNEGAALSFAESKLVFESDKDMRKTVISTFLFTRPGVGNFAFLAINAWPSAFLPSTFEDAEDRAIRFGNKCRDRVDNPVKVLAELGKATREGGIKRRIAADVHVEAAHGVMRAGSKAEALSVLDGYGYLGLPRKKKTGEVIENASPGRSIGATPAVLVKAAHRAVTTAPLFLPAFFTRGVLIDHVIDLQRTDELIRRHLRHMSKDDLVAAAMDRGLPGPHLDKHELRHELGNWLALVDGKVPEAPTKQRRGKNEPAPPPFEPRDPLRTRLALLGINSLEAARVTPEGAECRLLFAGP